MNREHKFRGQRVDTKEWVYGYLIRFSNQDFICNQKEIPIGIFCFNKPNGERVNAVSSMFSCFVEVLPETVGEYTGLTDRNGNEIYEDDAVKWLGIGIKYVGCVYWDKRKLYYIVKGIHCNRAIDTTDHEWFEIIGNTHDNPELMKA
ncbi:MAG: YopX family protein [Lutibacter sp.]|jgi:uncharacterized phage protein (TIGR01671 family)